MECKHQPGFDYTAHMRRLCSDIARRSPQMRHVDLSRVALSFARSRKPGPYGIWAALTPLRFEGGARHAVRNGRQVTCQRVLDQHGREMLYILNFYLPRFQDLSLTDKFTTIFHELWHISPNFNGDIRRFPGRCYAHSQSEEEYDALAAEMARKWLSLKPNPQDYAFLQYTFAELNAKHGPIYGQKVSHPRIIAVAG